MRRLLFLFVATGLIAATVTALASASHAKTSASVSPSQEAAWPWEPSGSIPAGTADNNWQYGKGDIADSQFSYWKQLTTSNVSGLKVAWDESIADAGYTGGIQSVPVVVSGKGKNLPDVNGTMFVAANKGIVALDRGHRQDPLEVRRPEPEAGHRWRCSRCTAAVRQHDEGQLVLQRLRRRRPAGWLDRRDQRVDGCACLDEPGLRRFRVRRPHRPDEPGQRL